MLFVNYTHYATFAIYQYNPWIKNNTDAGLHVVIELVEGHIYTMTLCVCVCLCTQNS